MVQSITQIPDAIQRSVYVKECARLMDIDERVLVEEVARKRVVQTGGGREASDFIRRQQMRQRREEQVAAAPEPQVDFTKGVAAGSATQELEKELLKYLLKFGHRSFDFKEGREVIAMNVADVIFSNLDAQGLQFETETYRKMFDTYRERRTELGEGTEVPAHLFVNHPDPAVCNAAVDILTSDDNYLPSKLWEQKEIHVESDEEKLSAGVPKAVILYKSNAIKRLIEEPAEAARLGRTLRGRRAGGGESDRHAQSGDGLDFAQGSADDSVVACLAAPQRRCPLPDLINPKKVAIFAG